MGISAADLAGMQATIASFETDSCTNQRTGVTTPCRVVQELREHHIEGLPRSLVVRRWRILVAEGISVKTGDSIVVPGRGTFSCLDTFDAQGTYPVETIAYCVLAREADGTLPLPTNATATFQQRDSFLSPVLLASKGVYIAPVIAPDEIARSGADSVRYQVIFDAAWTFAPGSDGVAQVISEEDTILLPYPWILDGKEKALENVQRFTFPLPITRATFRSHA